jgi:hypothetical protein
LACFQKTQTDVIKKVDTTTTSGTKVHSALNDGRLMLGDGDKMRSDANPFPVNIIEFEEKRVLVRTNQADTRKEKNVIASDKLRNKMMEP